MIGKSEDGKLSGMNDFMKNEVHKNFSGQNLKDGCRVPRGNEEAHERSIVMIVLFDFIIFCVASYRQRTG